MGHKGKQALKNTSMHLNFGYGVNYLALQF